MNKIKTFYGYPDDVRDEVETWQDESGYNIVSSSISDVSGYDRVMILVVYEDNDE